MDDQMQASFSGDLEVQRRLEAYAAVRLAPSSAVAARMRARVMREVRLNLAAQPAMPAPAAIADVAARRRPLILRRGAGMGLAAALTLTAAGGVMAASEAGGPLYPARIWLESVTLPAAGPSRTDADISRLESRITELLAAARRGDVEGVDAALLAYQEIADDALLAAAGDAAAIERLRLALDHHLGVLATVAAKVPPQAAESIERNLERAIQRNAATLERIQGKPAGQGSQPGGPASRPGGAGQPQAGTPKPEKSARPTPAPSDAVQPATTPHPQWTEPPAKPPKDPPQKPDKTPPGQGHPSAP